LLSNKRRRGVNKNIGNTIRYFYNFLTYRSIYAALAVMLILVASCSPTRRLKEGEYLLVKNQMETSSSPTLSRLGSESFILPRPNRKFLGFWRLYLQIYNLPNPDKVDSLRAKKELRLEERNARIIALNRQRIDAGKRPKRLKKYKPGFSEILQRIGEPPVLLDSSIIERNLKQLTAFASNKGFLQAKAMDSVSFRHDRKQAEVIFRYNPGPLYFINQTSYEVEDPSIEWFLLSNPGNYLFSDSLVRFDLDELDAERERISRILRANGYYGFDKESITYRADTNETSQRIHLTLKIPNPNYILPYQGDSLEIDQHFRFRIGKIYVVTDFDPTNPVSRYNDSTIVDGIIFYHTGKPDFNPKVLSKSIFLKTGRLYHPRDAERTRSALSELRNFRYINLRFRHRLSTNRIDSLDCFIDLTPGAPQSFTVDAQGTNTDGNLGVSLGTSYQNKNLFGGAEIFELRLNGGAEVQVIQGDSAALQNQTLPFNTLEIGAQISLTTPRFLAPFRVSKYASPRSRFLLSLNYQNRPDFSRTVSTGIFGYEWALPPSRLPGKNRKYNMFFQFNPIEISLIDISKTLAFDNFLDSINDQFVRNSFRQHFIQGISGSMWMTNQLRDNQFTHYFFRVNFQSGGNLLRGIHDIFLSDTKQANGTYKIFGIQFAQYVRLENDFRFFIRLNPKNNFAFRALAGVGIPFGNTTILPFEKSFFAGGANDIRAWLPRTLGPGSYQSQGGRVDQVGDIKLLGQAEYRFVIYKFLEGALFADFGNIWLIRSDIDRPGGTFAFDRFLNEFALGSGVGMRLNLGFFVFRLDLATPFRDPTFPEGDRWVITRFNPGKDLRLNIGIGYPF
jgi:outer membrane protein assembly factor BamA